MIAHSRDDRGRWLKRFGSVGTDSDIRLFCFHHAGGTASLYRRWPGLLPKSVEPVAVQLPGRADRYRERPFDAMGPLVDALVEVLEPLLDQRFALYGLSMGARISWALTHRLRDLAMPMPRALYLASAAAPGQEETKAGWAPDDEELVRYLREMGGTPPELFSQPELLAALLPTMRADLTLVNTFRLRPATPLSMPIYAFAGIDDIEGSPDRMSGWREETAGDFALHIVPGGHFFDSAGETQVIQSVGNDLMRSAANLR